MQVFDDGQQCLPCLWRDQRSSWTYGATPAVEKSPNLSPGPSFFHSLIHFYQSQTPHSSGLFAGRAEQRSERSTHSQSEEKRITHSINTLNNRIWQSINPTKQVLDMRLTFVHFDPKILICMLSLIYLSENTDYSNPWQLTWMFPSVCARFTSYFMTKSPSICVPSQPAHVLCCSIVGEKEMCACGHIHSV